MSKNAGEKCGKLYFQYSKPKRDITPTKIHTH